MPSKQHGYGFHKKYQVFFKKDNLSAPVNFIRFLPAVSDTQVKFLIVGLLNVKVILLPLITKHFSVYDIGKCCLSKFHLNRFGQSCRVALADSAIKTSKNVYTRLVIYHQESNSRLYSAARRKIMEILLSQTTEKQCKDCGSKLGPGRDDRQYCDSACKTNYNNRRRKENQKANDLPEQLSVPDYITRIQEIQLNNRRILEGLCSEEKPGCIRMRDLVGKGFNPKFITSDAEPTESGRVYRFCFEYGYSEDNGFAIIVCRKREVN